MEVGPEKENKVYDFPVNLDEKERIIFFEYARNNISEEGFEELMIEWALVDIVKEGIKRDCPNEKSTGTVEDSE